MRSRLGGRAALSLALAVALLAVIGGIAYATIPNSAGVYTACKLNSTGTIRLIDPSLGSGTPLGHCTSLESQITWNQQGQPGPQGLSGPAGPQGPKGDVGPAGPQGPAGTNGMDGAPGAPGAAGKDGKDGTSVTVSDEPAGANCANGGAKLVSVSGTTYVCNGANGVGVVDSRSATNTVVVPAHSVVTAFAQCNWAPGFTLSGAATTSDPAVFVSSQGVGGRGSWQATASNNGDVDGTVTVFVTCVEYG
jgi:Collagen triple helix repeat (20 copies)